MRSNLVATVAFALALFAAAPHAHAQAQLHRLQLRAPELQLQRATPHLLDTPLALPDSHRVGLGMDFGGGSHARGGGREIAGFLIGMLVGFGIGHLIVGSRDGFVLFLIVDVVFVVALIVLWDFTPHIVAVLATLGFVVERVFQGYDAYTSGGGRPVVERSLENTIYVKDDERPALPRLQPVSRAFSWSF